MKFLVLTCVEGELSDPEFFNTTREALKCVRDDIINQTGDSSVYDEQLGYALPWLYTGDIDTDDPDEEVLNNIPGDCFPISFWCENANHDNCDWKIFAIDNIEIINNDASEEPVPTDNDKPCSMQSPRSKFMELMFNNMGDIVSGLSVIEAYRDILPDDIVVIDKTFFLIEFKFFEQPSPFTTDPIMVNAGNRMTKLLKDDNASYLDMIDIAFHTMCQLAKHPVMDMTEKEMTLQYPGLIQEILILNGIARYCFKILRDRYMANKDTYRLILPEEFFNGNFTIQIDMTQMNRFI